MGVGLPIEGTLRLLNWRHGKRSRATTNGCPPFPKKNSIVSFEDREIGFVCGVIGRKLQADTYNRSAYTARSSRRIGQWPWRERWRLPTIRTITGYLMPRTTCKLTSRATSSRDGWL